MRRYLENFVELVTGVLVVMHPLLEDDSPQLLWEILDPEM